MLSNKYLKMAKYLADHYPPELTDIIDDSQMRGGYYSDYNSVVYVAECIALDAQLVYKIGKSYNEGRVYQLDKIYNIGTNWYPVHIIHCRNGNALLEKVLHYLFYGSRAFVKVSREIFVLAPSEISWLKSVNYVDEERLSYLIQEAYLYAKHWYPNPNGL
jgi:hypothetical protein